MLISMAAYDIDFYFIGIIFYTTILYYRLLLLP